MVTTLHITTYTMRRDQTTGKYRISCASRSLVGEGKSQPRIQGGNGAGTVKNFNHISSHRDVVDSLRTPSCPGCGRVFSPGATWTGANFCRGLFLLQVIENAPSLSGWELAQRSGVPYTDAIRGLAKLREYDVVITESEDRPEGGIRYRYWPGDVERRSNFKCVASGRGARNGF